MGLDEILEAASRFELEIKVLQTSALPLGYAAFLFSLCLETGPRPCTAMSSLFPAFGVAASASHPKKIINFAQGRKVERETGFEPATSTLARLHSTAELLPLNGNRFLSHRGHSVKSNLL